LLLWPAGLPSDVKDPGKKTLIGDMWDKVPMGSHTWWRFGLRHLMKGKPIMFIPRLGGHP